MVELEGKLAPEMQETMNRLIKIEQLAEEILTIKAQMVEYDKKRNYNRESLGALRRGEIQSNNKLWLSFGESMVKLPRKNLVQMVEDDQVQLNKEIERSRKELKEKISIMVKL